MGNNIRILGPTHIGLTVPIVASTADAAFPVGNLETGNRQLFWKSTVTTETTLTWDMGVGLTKTCDTVVLPRADLLVAAAWNVAVQWSNDGATGWTDAATAEVPIQANDLVGPRALDYYKEFTSLAKRAWRIRLYGSPSSVAMLAGGIFLGTRYEVVKNPLYGRPLGVSRAVNGLELELTWGHWRLEADARGLLDQLALLNPDAADGPVETVSGVMFGGLPHYWYDPVGATMRTAGTPGLLPALLVTPEAVQTTTPAKAIEQGPVGIRLRERR
jgi:hypothetical protein